MAYFISREGKLEFSGFSVYSTDIINRACISPLIIRIFKSGFHYVQGHSLQNYRENPFSELLQRFRSEEVLSPEWYGDTTMSIF